MIAAARVVIVRCPELPALEGRIASLKSHASHWPVLVTDVDGLPAAIQVTCDAFDPLPLWSHNLASCIASAASYHARRS